jgi:hypothetical protein
VGDPKADGLVREAGRVARPRGQTLVALIVLAVVLLGGMIAQRVGVRAAGEVPGATATSGAWLCPHGGGKDWAATVYVANPGSSPVTVRARSLGEGRPVDLGTTTVQPGASAAIEARSPDVASATALEYFGGWVAAGWVARAGGGQVGVAAEPCLSGASQRWTLPDGDTEQKESAYVVVMNPFASDAVFDVTWLTDGEPPKGLTDFSDFVLPAGHSAAFKLNRLSLGQAAIAARIDVSIGRVAAATLGVSSKFGIRSSVGWPGTPPQTVYLPGGGDSGASVLAVADPSQTPASFSASILGDKGIQLADKVQDRAQDGTSATAYPVTTGEAATLAVHARQGGPGVVAARRTRGTTQDLGSTAGVAAPRSAWVVMPATGSAPRSPMVYLANPGRRSVEVSMSTLPVGGREATAKVTVPPGRTVAAPGRLFSSAGDAPVLATADAGTFVASAASYSQGAHGVAGYAVSSGIAIPEPWIPRT